MKTRDYGWVLGALVIATMVGALMGVLFAPRSGEKTRKMLNKQAAHYRDQAEELYAEGAAHVDDAIDKGKAVAKKTEKTGRQLKIDARRLKEQVAAPV